MTIDHRAGSGAFWGLSQKERETLRLMVRGHDAKSIARHFGLSVHTINERLRDARRKMGVSSSREAARMLMSAEDSVSPESFGDAEIGADADHSGAAPDGAPIGGAGRGMVPASLLAGAVIMSLILATFAVLGLSPDAPASPSPVQAQEETALAGTARDWLVLLDHARWADSYQRTGEQFRRLNTLDDWTAASLRARVPLGEVRSRRFLSQENLPAPPAGYEVVKFRTRFANRAEATETVTLDREAGDWRVVGVTIS